jgi:hypothetical protein
MHRPVHLALTALLIVALTGCDQLERERIDGSGTIVEESRTASGFDEIELNGAAQMDVTVASGGEYSLFIEVDDNLLAEVETAVRGGRLVIDISPDIDPTDEVRITVATPVLESVVLNGSADVVVDGIAGTSFDAEVNGSGAVIPNGEFERLTLVVNGSGRSVPTGTAARLDATVNGSGRIDAADLSVPDGSVTVNGSGSAVVAVSGTLDATVSGSGRISYLGDPAVDRSVSGSGRIEQG